jgi:hypothetical protein
LLESEHQLSRSRRLCSSGKEPGPLETQVWFTVESQRFEDVCNHEVRSALHVSSYYCMCRHSAQYMCVSVLLHLGTTPLP